MVKGLGVVPWREAASTAGRQQREVVQWADAARAADLTAGLGHRLAAGLVYAGRAGAVRPSGVRSTNTL